METDPWQQWHAFTAAAPCAPPSDLADRFNRLARSFLDASTGTAAGKPPTPPGEAAQAFSEALRDLFAPLQPSFTGARTTTALGPADLLTNPPAFGAGREHQLRAQRLAAAARRLDEAHRRLQRLWLDALRDAGAAFMNRLEEPMAPVEGAAAVRALYDAWIDCAEDAYSRIAHGAPFCEALADSVNAASDWRRELRETALHAAALLDLPTRAELNTLHRQLRAAEERISAVEANLRAPPTPSRAPKPRAPRSRGKKTP
ncbi:MAG: hypothetical protein KGI55_03070 [Gammaproteobacteria bacterium]|nr:hypothetical protein [Gammaproteobacteria bacterium]